MRETRQIVSQQILVPLGQELRNMRKHRKLTQRELSQMISKTPNAISKYEGGSRNLNILTLAELGSALNCQVTIQLTPFESL